VLLQVHRPGNVLPEQVVTTVVLKHFSRYIDRATQEYIPSFFAPPRLG
jgi:hypothetical protein